MDKKQYIEVRISVEQIKKKLIDCFSKNTPFASLIADTIVDNISTTEMGLSHLYNAFSGVKPEVHVKIGDDVLVPWDNMPSWRMSKEKMQEAHMLKHDKYIKAVVEQINFTRRESVTVRYNSIDDKGVENTSTYSLIPEVVYQATEEFPENLGDGF